MDSSPALVESAKLSCNALGGSAAFITGNYLNLHRMDLPRFACIYSDRTLARHHKAEIRSALAQQVCAADYVCFSVPSAYSEASEHWNERLLTREVWEDVLSPFCIVDLKYFSGPSGKERILCTLKGQDATPDLLELMTLSDQPYPNGISVILLARNEEKNIAACLDPLKDLADEIIVADMQSTDATVEIARQYTDNIIHHPLISNFDSSRNCSAMKANYRWILFIDCDEVCPAELCKALKFIVWETTPQFSGMYLPMKHWFANHWHRAQYP